MKETDEAEKPRRSNMSENSVSNFYLNKVPKRVNNSNVFGDKPQDLKLKPNSELCTDSMTPKKKAKEQVNQRQISAVSMDKILPANYLADNRGGYIEEEDV